MWKKTNTLVMICILCVFFSFHTARAAEIVKTQNVTDYRQISGLISNTWEEDYFEKMVVTPGSNQMEKDGEKEKVSKEFEVSSSKARTITQSEQTMDAYLDKQDGIYEVETNEDGNLEITAPYQTKRLVIQSDFVSNTYGAKEVYINKMDKETILQYETEEDTKDACEKLQKVYSTSECYPDKVVSISDSSMGLPLSEEEIEGEESYSWGNTYMGMNELKQEAPTKGYTRLVTVAVVDTGINASHPMFQGRTISSQSYNFFSNNKNVEDTFGHGTHVSGIIADATPSNVALLVLKVSNSEGKSSLLTIRTALQYAVSKNADVVNLSMGFIDGNAYEYNYLNPVIDKAYEKGIPVCCAAGNQESGGIDVRYCYPACYDKTIAVSAIDSSQRLASYSNRGNGIDFTAPGTGIISADYKGKTKAMSGTSMAAPHITAAIAYLKMIQPNLSVDGVYRELKLYCRDLGAAGKDSYYGWGCPILTNLFQNGIVNTKYIIILRPNITAAYNEGNGIKLSWTPAAGAAQYYVYRKGNKGVWKNIAVVSSTQISYVDKGTKQGQKYSYKVRAYNNGLYGGFSNSQILYRLKNPGTIKVKRSTGKKVKVFWKKKSYATTYQVQYAWNPQFSHARKVSTGAKKGCLQTKKLKKKTYYFRVRYSYKKGSVKSWSAWSKVKKIKL